MSQYSLQPGQYSNLDPAILQQIQIESDFVGPPSPHYVTNANSMAVPTSSLQYQNALMQSFNGHYIGHSGAHSYSMSNSLQSDASMPTNYVLSSSLRSDSPLPSPMGLDAYQSGSFRISTNRDSDLDSNDNDVTEDVFDDEEDDTYCDSLDTARFQKYNKRYRLLRRASSNLLIGASTVAIDNKIEQAMDLVKSHLMYAVREEVEVLREQIKELLEKNSQLEYENQILRQGASQETLSKIQQPRPSRGQNQPPSSTS